MSREYFVIVKQYENDLTFWHESYDCVFFLSTGDCKNTGEALVTY